MTEITDIITQRWDVIVVGTGIGGATLGYALAKAGKRVLFCEKGRLHLGDAEALTGRYAEQSFAQPSVPRPEHRELLARAGRCWDQIEDCSASKPRRFIPFIGASTGGSSALYGMAMERFFPEDFTPRRNYPDIAGTSLPERWPISYQDLAPYYTAAEQLYRVRGGGDPLRAEETVHPLPALPPLMPAAQELTQFLQDKNLHPYRLPMACESVPGCECCQGYLCPRECKNDSARICLQPALAQHGAALLDQCEVVRLEATREAVTGVVCERQGKQFVLKGDLVVLAAGALVTPNLLLRSRSDFWPNGLANDSGLVGRNLMRHFVDLYLITPRHSAGDNRHKELAFNDFYHSPERLGTVQSFGRLPPAEMLAESLEQDIHHGPLPWLAKPFRWVKPMLKPMLRRMVERSLVLAGIMEDLPYPDNRVTIGSDQRSTQLYYRIQPTEQARIERFRDRVREALRPYKVQIVKQAENNERIAHACGTCRFGENPKESVLDPRNRAHGLGNLYVVDSSFFPSSGGTNPSLTIAANSLRVAEDLCGIRG
ncbi:MAG: GMC family oxidoreductase [Candidatus Competibacteraceae bacterium]|nr:GMC family oxidoreductase [Candidatus Competibacteraceae bacterium]